MPVTSRVFPLISAFVPRISGCVITPSVCLLSTSTPRFSHDDSSTAVQSSSQGEVSVQYRNGLPVITLPLPSRRERCQFTLKPVSHTIGDFSTHIYQEDRGIDIVVFYAEDGTKLANSTQIQHLLLLDRFQLRINDQVFLAEPPSVLQPPLSDGEEQLLVPQETVQSMGQVQALVGALYGTLNVEEYQRRIEADLIRRMEEIDVELEPMERTKSQLQTESEKRSERFLWLGLAAMGIQFGAFARLTWWEYSWDIMEPVTYFATYGTAIGAFVYYLLTKQSYEYPDAKDRIHLFGMYRRARKVQFNIDKYNRLIKAKSEIEYDLKKLRDPFFLLLPLDRVMTLMKDRESAYSY